MREQRLEIRDWWFVRGSVTGVSGDEGRLVLELDQDHYAPGGDNALQIGGNFLACGMKGLEGISA
jgi:hypothetical protein